ncbi:type II toxin-antitoxin system PemK/MazF family toxin [Rhizobium sullae]|nr:type II toxin-antitoxin system PemK/MazF family toxin [Rhizobium sullae]
MKQIERGAVFTIAAKGIYTGKPRPAIVVQSDELDIESVLIVPLTTETGGSRRVRIEIGPTAENGLKKLSYAMCDKISAVPASNLKTRVGALDPQTMTHLESGLLNVLGLHP